MPLINGSYINPFYHDISPSVKAELKYRSSAYGNRIRSVPPTEKRDEGAERLFWSYGKIAWAKITPENKDSRAILGTVSSKLMSGADGKLILYDQVRNVPKYPLLQGLTISNEGTIGSLLKGSFDFTIFPQYVKTGFKLEPIENAYFKPGRTVKVEWGWSERTRSNSNSNRGSFEGIIYNFEWSVNTDLSISAKCSVVSKGSIAIGLSGEQHNPDSGQGEPVQDPLGNEILDTDLAGVLERDVSSLGGTKNTSVSLTGTTLLEIKDSISAKNSGGKFFTYQVVPIPRSLRDADPDTLNQEQKDKQAADKEAVEEATRFQGALQDSAITIATKLDEKASLEKKLNEQNLKPEEKEQIQNNIDAIDDELYGSRSLLTAGIRTGGLYADAEAKAVDGGAWTQFWTNKDENFRSVLDAEVAKIRQKTAQGQTTKTVSQVYKQPDAPEPIAEATYFISLEQLAAYFNDKLTRAGSPFGAITSVQVSGNETQYLQDIVSTTPDKVFFPDSLMGKYGQFSPFALTNIGFKKNTEIDIGKILVSTTCVIETYREFLKENQTNISFKNITGFWDALIKKVNYASGETYQLTVRVVEPSSIPGGKQGGASILSVEDSNISVKVTKFTPYMFESNIAKPILKNISISSKPPGPMAAAAFAEARGDSAKMKSQQVDVRAGKSGGNVDESTKALGEITKLKEQMIKVGVSDKFSQDLKGAYTTYKRAQTDSKNAHWLNKAIYPVNLTLTIDGINGFTFGDVLKTNLVPAQYNAAGLVFVITKVGHTIKDGVWETTLETKARLDT